MDTRVVLIDFNHMVHTLYHSQHRLSTRLVQNGEVIEKDTTVQNGAIKNIFRWSNKGAYPTAVCFDRRVISRKGYFQSKFPNMEIGSGKEYKGNREKMPEAMFEAISDCETLLKMGGVSCFAYQNYEADDLIYACVKRAKEKYPGCPIDIITNDADLLPLVDDTVSVFLRSKVATYAVRKDLEKNHYIQVTSDNYQSVIENLSAYRGFYLPYNTILLHKLLRGDSSDQFGCKEISRMFPAKKFNAMVTDMIADGADISNAFRYSDPKYSLVYKDTGKIFNGTISDALKSADKNRIAKKVEDSETLTNILNLLRRYSSMSEEQIQRLGWVYTGMNLNQAYASSVPELCRKSVKIGSGRIPDIERFDEFDLQKAVNAFRIRLPL